MTEKRFTYEYDEYNGNLFDNKMNTFYHIEDSDENIEVLCDRLNWLVEENEQLKQEIRQLQHWNKCLAEKRHQELSYRPYTTSKSEKELKELLEPKLFNCSDR